MIASPTVRRPRFLSSVPPAGEIEPAHFTRPKAGDANGDVPSPPRLGLAMEDRQPGSPAPDRDDRKPSAPARANTSQAAESAPAEPAPELRERVAAAIEALKLNSERLAEQARSDALEIAFLVARRILETELTARVEPLLALVRSAVRRAGESRKIVIRLSPADAEAIGAAAQRGSLSDVATVKVEISPDSTLARGDCVVESELGTVDGRLSTRLEELRRAVVAAVEEEVA